MDLVSTRFRWQLVVGQCLAEIDAVTSPDTKANLVGIFAEMSDFDKDLFYDIIEVPLTLGTIRDRLHMSIYLNPAEFEAYMRAMFDNFFILNDESSSKYTTGLAVLRLYEGIWKENLRAVSFKLYDEIPQDERDTVRAILPPAIQTIWSKLKEKATRESVRPPCDLESITALAPLDDELINE
jgi:hypothetical protein